MSHAILGELDRRLANIVRVGTIKALNPTTARVQVDLGDLTTDWLPWGTGRAGGDRSWSAPEVGEQVVLFAPSGELAAAIVMGSIPQDAHPAPASSADHTRYQWQDGAFIEYDRAGHSYTLDIPSGGTIMLHVGQTVLKLEDGKATLTTPEFDVVAPQSTFTGNVLVQGALAYQGGLTGSGGSAAATITGPVSINGAVTTVGALTNNGHDVGSGHRHTGVQTGGGTTGAPQ
jgi:phage baseplate assembly protein V